VVGVFQPKLFIAEQIFSLLSEEELAAAILHESGHLATHDNFKRVLLRVCGDLLVFPMGKTLEREWAQCSESAADEYAAQIKAETALDLASALVKIARIVPPAASPNMPLGAFLIEKTDADITGRVRRLLLLAENLNPLAQTASFNLRLALQICAALTLTSILVLATNHHFLFEVYTRLERFVALLQ
jgi:beta-lactamase regulating signal transducer with metallopeptidase domain